MRGVLCVNKQKGDGEMRLLVWFTVGFASGCGLGLLLFQGVFLPVLALGFLIGCVLLGFVGTPSARMKLLSLIFGGCAIGLGWIWMYDMLELRTARAYDGVSTELSIEVTDYSYETTGGVAADGRILLDGESYKIRFYIDEYELLRPGDQVSGVFELRFTGFGGEQSPTYHQGKGIFLLAYPDESITVSQRDNIPAKYFTAVLRNRILNKLNQLFPEDTAGFARALLLGDTTDLSDKDDYAFKISGIRHIIAVSGLHVSILFTFIYTLMRKRRWPTALVGLPLLILFAALAGFTPSIVRACVMQGLMILALLSKREYDGPTALAFAVLVILLCNPISLTAVGFQLSVGCVIGIFLFSERIRRYLYSKSKKGLYKDKRLKGKLFRWLCGSVSMTLGATLLTTPLSAYYFGYLSIVGLLGNLLTLWAVSLIFYGITVACLLGFIWLPAGRLIAWVISWLMRYVTGVAGLLSALPFAAVSLEDLYIQIWLIFAYILIAIQLFTRPKRPFLTVGCISVGLACSLFLSAAEIRSEDFSMTVLDVGQGQCILLESGNTCYVVDCGGDYAGDAADLAAQALRTDGFSQIDGMILTHFDQDHAGGAESLLAQLATDVVYLPNADPDNVTRSELEADHGERLYWVEEPVELTCGKARITIFPGEPGEDGNNSSLCILFQTEECDILITGDRSSSGEAYLLEQTQLPDLEILVAGHHGSESSTSLPLLAETTPDIVVISVGADNSYGHPTQAVLNRLDIFGCMVWRTDIHGTIIFRG